MMFWRESGEVRFTMNQPHSLLSGPWSTAEKSSQRKSQSLLINELSQLNIIDHFSLVTSTVGTARSTVVTEVPWPDCSTPGAGKGEPGEGPTQFAAILNGRRSSARPPRRSPCSDPPPPMLSINTSTLSIDSLSNSLSVLSSHQL